MSKNTKIIYACQQCGNQSRKWLGKCPDCNSWNSFVQEHEAPSSSFGLSSSLLTKNLTKPLAYAEILSQDYPRIPSGIAEFDRTLGGGIVPGSLILIGGDPGVGKSTLLIEVAEKLSKQNRKVLYISGEESERQIKLRGERLGLEPGDLHLLSETCLERIFDVIANLQPDMIVLDSVQTAYSQYLDSSPGSISQVRETAGKFLILSKQHTIPTFLIGHITKEGTLAGPKTLEHMVDTVLYFEGERHHNHRIVRAVKNRFGPANELGIFEMTGNGLIPVTNPSKLFLQQRPLNVSGSVVIACMEGTRPLLVELQALVSSSKYGTGRRMVQGVEQNRVALLIAVLEKRLGLQLLGDDVFVNVAGGIVLDEPAADLGIITAITSSFKNVPIDSNIVVFGEVGLAGEVRAITQPTARIKESAAMGFTKCIIPQANSVGLEVPKSLELIGVHSVFEALDIIFN